MSGPGLFPSLTDMWRRLATPALALASAVALIGCTPMDRRASDERTESGSLTEVTLSGGGGAVTIEQGTEATTRIKRVFRYGGNARPHGRDRVDGSVLRLDTDCGTQCSVDYTVTVPSAVKVTGASAAGAVTLRGVGAVSLTVESGRVSIRGAGGKVDVFASSGSILVEDATGAVTARAESGSIDVRRAGGAVIAEASSGSLRVRDSTGESVIARSSSGSIHVSMGRPLNVRAMADSGNIRVSVPAGIDVDVATTTDNGEPKINVPDVADAPHKLDLQTDSGSIHVVQG